MSKVIQLNLKTWGTLHEVNVFVNNTKVTNWDKVEGGQNKLIEINSGNENLEFEMNINGNPGAEATLTISYNNTKSILKCKVPSNNISSTGFNILDENSK